ncbi:MAG: sporulation protein YqfD [Lachnospiraceae bacterium]|nr:sporulation protein YqfD [Lachnospiraceae bacterium]
MKEKATGFVSGVVRICIQGENKERFVNLCRSSDIYIWDIRDSSDYSLCVSVEDFFRLKPIIKKTAVKTKIQEKYGLPFLIHQYRKRKMFVAGILTSFVIIYVLSLFIWDMQVDGNYSYSDYEILKFLQENSITPGIKKSKLNCDEIEKEIRNHYFDITWVSVEMTGTRLIVHIKENEEELRKEGETDEPKPTEGVEYDIVAIKDAVVTNIITRSGTPAVKADLEVKAGDTLVYGRYDVVNDSSEVVRTQYLAADADIYGKVVYQYEYNLPLNYTKKEYNKSKNRFSLRIGNKIYRLTDNKEEEETDIITEEKQLSLYGDFYLPVFLMKSTYKSYEEKEYIYSEEQAVKLCEEKLSYFLEKLEKNTIQIVENNVTIEVNNDMCQSKGTITVIENIGQLRAVENEPITEITEETGESYE